MHDESAEQWRNLSCWNESRNTFFDRALLVEVRVVRRVTGQQLICKRAETIYIVGWCWWFSAQLGRASSKRRIAVLVGIASWTGGQPRARSSHRSHRRFCDAEVRQPCPAARVEQDVTRLQVAVNDSALMRMFQGLCNFQEYRNDFEEARTA
jgi:hypothetical protein